MTSNASKSTVTGAHKRNSDDVGWEYGFCPDKSKLDRVKCSLCGKEFSGGVFRMKQHIAHVTGNVSSCPKSTKDDQLKCRNSLNDAKLKKKVKQAYDAGLRSEVNLESHGSIHGSIEVDGMQDALGTKAPNVIGPMDDFANKINPEEAMKSGKGKKVDLNDTIRKERILTVHKYIARWAYECAIPFHAFESDSFKMLLEVIGQFGTGLPPPTRYALSETLLKHEVERTKTLLKRNEQEWKDDGCSIMTDAWSDRKRRSIMNLCVNSKMGTVFLSSKECSNEAHTSEHIYDYVESCIQEVGPENVVQVVTDNATNNMGASKLLKEKRPTIFWTSCATHTINLMLEGIGGNPRFKKVLDQAKKLTIFIYAHHKTLAMMRGYTNKREIIRPGVTRFASAYLTLQSLSEKKEQLRHMFSSNEWEACKFSGTAKGKVAYATVRSVQFWTGVTLCLKVFSPLVKVLRMVDADWKPSMGFVYGEIKVAKEEIIKALGGNEKAYTPITDIIEKKMKGRLDTNLHLTAYLLNPYYHYKDPQLQHDPDVMDAVLGFFDTILFGDLELQRKVVTVELPKYKKKVDRFGIELAHKSCMVNDPDFDPASWWGLFGGSTPNLTKIAMRILSLTSSSSGCERNWSTFEAVHTKKRNRLETSRLNNLVYVQFNANLMEKNKKRKDRTLELLLASDSHAAQEWLVDEVVPESNAERVDTEGVDTPKETDEQVPRESSSARELFDEDFVSDDEADVFEEGEYDSDGVQILEDLGDD